MPDLADHTAPIGEVAAALGRSEVWLRRNWLKLALNDGFPRKHPSGWTWPRAAVEAWLRAAPPNEPLAGAQPGFTNDNAPADLDAAYGAALGARYGGQA